jgi:hypothetical protein
MEQDLRKQAIERYLKGESPKNIYSDLDRSKNWFFKWLKRYQSGEPNWYKERFRAPVNRPKAITASDRKRIIKTWLHLESQKYAETVPSAIKWELTKAGHTLPSDSTIKRVLKQEGLIKKNALRPQRVEYPYFTEAFDINHIHQADLVGPCYIKGDGRFLFIQRHRSLQPSGLCRGPAHQSRSASRWKSAALLEGRRASGFSAPL